MSVRRWLFGLVMLVAGAAHGAEPTLADGATDAVIGPAEIRQGLVPFEDEAALQAVRECCTNCPEWPRYFVFDVLFLQRDNATNGQPIAIGSNGSPNPGAPILTTQSMQFATAPGLRLLYGERRPDGVGWEIGYLGVYGMYADAGIASPDQLAVPGDLGSAVPGWSTADIERPTYWSSLN